MRQLRILKHKKILLTAGALGIMIGTFAILNRPKADDARDIIWREYQAAYEDIIVSLDGGGTLEATGIDHSFEVDLKIEKIMAGVGQEVKTGDALVQYSQDSLKDKIRELKDSLKKARRTLEDAKNNKRKAQLEQALAYHETQQELQSAYESSKEEIENQIRDGEKKITQLQEKQANLIEELINAQALDDSTGGSGKLDERKEEQMDELQKENEVLSAKEEKINSLKEQIQQVQTEVNTVQSDLETQQSAMSRLDNSHNTKWEQEKEKQAEKDKINTLANASLDNAINNAQTEVKTLRRTIAAAEKVRETPVLTARTDGVITKLPFAEGDDVPGGKSVVTIGDSAQKRVAAQIPQEDIGGISVGQEAEMQFLATPQVTLKGVVLEKILVPSEGGDGVTYKVTIAFEEEQPELLQGMTCSVRFIQKRVEHVLTLSNKAITLKDGKQSVTVLLPDGTHEEREIKTGFSDGRVSEITGGLAEGETVVTKG